MHPLLAVIKENFAKAERNIKEIERLGEGIASPAVNQLRYVAFHLLRALDPNEDISVDDEYREALYHAHRALHDSSEIGIAFLLGQIQKFQNDYKTVTVTDVVPEYLAICRDANDAKRYISTRTENSIKEHANGWKVKHPDIAVPTERFNLYYKLLYEYVGRLKIARLELNKKVKIRRNAFFVVVITIALSIISLLISLYTKA